jgi:hypothetical protein
VVGFISYVMRERRVMKYIISSEELAGIRNANWSPFKTH